MARRSADCSPSRPRDGRAMLSVDAALRSWLGRAHGFELRGAALGSGSSASTEQEWRSAAAAPDLASPAWLRIDSVTLEVADITAAHDFYDEAFGLGSELQLRTSDAPTSGFRGFTLSLTVAQPANATALIDAALRAGATALKPAGEVAVGVRRRRAGSGRDDLEGRVIEEEGHRPGLPRDRPDRAPAGRRGRAPRASGSTSTVASPRTPVSPRTAAARTGSASTATPAPSPTRTGSSGRRRRPRTRSSRQPKPRSRSLAESTGTKLSGSSGAKATSIR